MTVLRCIWKDKNQEVIEHKEFSLVRTKMQIKGFVCDLTCAFWQDGKSKDRREERCIKWNPPPANMIKINTDARVGNRDEEAAIGGVLREDHGKGIIGFKGKIGKCALNMAELWAIREGLSLAWERRHPQVILETDSEIAVRLIKEADVKTHQAGVLIEDCRKLV